MQIDILFIIVLSDNEVMDEIQAHGIWSDGE